MTLLEGMILILFIVWAVKEIANQENKKLFKGKFFNRIHFPKCPIKWRVKIPIYLFIFFATVSIFISPNKQAALGIWKAYFIEPFLFVIVFTNVFNRSRHSERSEESRALAQWTVDPSLSLRMTQSSQHSIAEYSDHPWGAMEHSNSILANPFLFITTALSIPALYISLFAVYQKITGFLVPYEYWQAGYHRVTSFFSYPNAIGLLLAPMVMLLFGAVLAVGDTESVRRLSPSSQRRGVGGGVINRIKLFTIGRRAYYRIYFAFVAALSVLAIFFAQSEGAIIGLAGGLLVFCFLYNKKTRIVSLAVLLLAIIVGGSFYMTYGQKWNEVFAKTALFELDTACVKPLPDPPLKGEGTRSPSFEEGDRGRLKQLPCKIYQKLTFQDVSGAIRLEMWNETFQMLKSNLVFGTGLAGYQNAMEQYHTKDFVEIYLYPHNIILNFWSEIGLFGLLAFIWMMIVFFYLGAVGAGECHAERKPDTRHYIKITLISSMSVLLIHGLADVPYFKNDLAVLFWIIYGMMILSLIYTKQNLSPPTSFAKATAVKKAATRQSTNPHE